MAGGRASLAVGLPQSGPEYDQAAFQGLLDYVKALEERVYLRNTHLEIWAPPDSGGRQPLLVLRSDDGLTRYSITVNALGEVVATSIGATGTML
jgi:hypothetical protein